MNKANLTIMAAVLTTLSLSGAAEQPSFLDDTSPKQSENIFSGMSESDTAKKQNSKSAETNSGNEDLPFTTPQSIKKGPNKDSVSEPSKKNLAQTSEGKPAKSKGSQGKQQNRKQATQMGRSQPAFNVDEARERIKIRDSLNDKIERTQLELQLITLQKEIEEVKNPKEGKLEKNLNELSKKLESAVKQINDIDKENKEIAEKAKEYKLEVDALKKKNKALESKLNNKLMMMTSSGKSNKTSSKTKKKANEPVYKSDRLFLIRTGSVFGKKNAKVFFEGQIVPVNEGSIIFDSIEIKSIDEDFITVVETVKKKTKTKKLYLTTLQNAYSKSSTKKEAVQKQPQINQRPNIPKYIVPHEPIVQ